MSSDDIEWEPPADEIEWGILGLEQSEPKPIKFTKKLVQYLRGFNSKWIITILVICLVVTTSIAMIEAQQIAILNNEIDDLQQQYNTLEQDYEDLLSNYNDLFSDYNALETAFEEPLSNPVIPTYFAVMTWLSQDDTDECEYVEGVWSCGDFAAMLMTRAKEMNWRVRIAVISYSFQGEPNYGSIWPYGSHGGHAFNVIECTDGVWYIEPQSDGTWYIVDGITEDRTEFSVYEYYNFVDSDLGTVWDGYRWWTNYYNQFA
ncbi:unnamed protein product [marine sediment metagenome]|uniref:Uncharacterized protein n=1 Tax=marine sediment metagenome TaxID=412755 RepID=X1A0P3_9ZZZZ